MDKPKITADELPCASIQSSNIQPVRVELRDARFKGGVGTIAPVSSLPATVTVESKAEKERQFSEQARSFQASVASRRIESRVRGDVYRAEAVLQQLDPLNVQKQSIKLTDVKGIELYDPFFSDEDQNEDDGIDGLLSSNRLERAALAQEMAACSRTNRRGSQDGLVFDSDSSGSEEIDDASRDDEIESEKCLSEELKTMTHDEVCALLLSLLRKLRSKFNYCLYCGCAFSSAEELTTSCPGEIFECH